MNSPREMVSVILPCLNERENIAPLIRRLRRALPTPREIIVVDDDSPDRTGDVVRAEAAACRDVRLLTRVGERGLASALQKGIDTAQGKILAWMDCDLSMPPETLAELAAAVRDGHCDAAVGSRYVSDSADLRLRCWTPPLAVQVLCGVALSRAAMLLLHSDFRDWTSGFIAVRRSVLPLPLRGEHGEYFIRLIHSLLLDHRRVLEFPYKMSPRRWGESKTAPSLRGLLRRGPKYLAAIAGCAYSRWRPQ